MGDNIIPCITHNLTQDPLTLERHRSRHLRNTRIRQPVRRTDGPVTTRTATQRLSAQQFRLLAHRDTRDRYGFPSDSVYLRWRSGD
jgi:hypothetical protein